MASTECPKDGCTAKARVSNPLDERCSVHKAATPDGRPYTITALCTHGCGGRISEWECRDTHEGTHHVTRMTCRGCGKKTTNLMDRIPGYCCGEE